MGATDAEELCREPWLAPADEERLHAEALHNGDLDADDMPIRLPPCDISPRGSAAQGTWMHGAGRAGTMGLDTLREEVARLIEDEREIRSDGLREVRAICAALTLSFEGRVQELIRCMQQEQIPASSGNPTFAESFGAEVFHHAEQLVSVIKQNLGDRCWEQINALREDMARLDGELAQERMVRSDHMTAQLRLIESLPYKDIAHKLDIERAERTSDVSELRSHLTHAVCGGANVISTSVSPWTQQTSPAGCVGTVDTPPVLHTQRAGSDAAAQVGRELAARLESLDADLRKTIAASTATVEAVCREAFEQRVDNIGKDLNRELDSRLEGLESVLPERVWAMERALRDMEADILCLLRDSHRSAVPSQEVPAGSERHPTPSKEYTAPADGSSSQQQTVRTQRDLKSRISGIICDVQAALQTLPGKPAGEPVAGQMPSGVPTSEEQGSVSRRTSTAAMCASPGYSVGLHKTVSVPTVSSLQLAPARSNSPVPMHTVTRLASPFSPARRHGGSSSCAASFELPVSPVGHHGQSPMQAWHQQLSLDGQQDCPVLSGDMGEPHTPMQRQGSTTRGTVRMGQPRRSEASPRRLVPPTRVLVQCPSSQVGPASTGTASAATPAAPGPWAAHSAPHPPSRVSTPRVPGRASMLQAGGTLMASRCSSRTPQLRQCLVGGGSSSSATATTARPRLAVTSPTPTRGGGPSALTYAAPY